MSQPEQETEGVTYLPKVVSLEEWRKLKARVPQEDWHDVLRLWGSSYCGRCGAEGERLREFCPREWP